MKAEYKQDMLAKQIKYVSHDLRHLLAQICSLSYLIDQDISNHMHPNYRRYCLLIEELAQQGLNMTLECLDPTANQGCTQHERIDSVHHFFDQMRTVYESKAKQHQIQLEVAILKPDGEAYIRPLDLKRILDNLFSNALKFTPGGGKISIRASREAHSLIIQVQDSGIGMSKRMRQAVYVDGRCKSRSGLRGEASYGLGLDIVRELVLRHQGTLCCFPSNPGTVFSVDLPLR